MGVGADTDNKTVCFSLQTGTFEMCTRTLRWSLSPIYNFNSYPLFSVAPQNRVTRGSGWNLKTFMSSHQWYLRTQQCLVSNPCVTTPFAIYLIETEELARLQCVHDLKTPFVTWTLAVLYRLSLAAPATLKYVTMFDYHLQISRNNVTLAS